MVVERRLAKRVSRSDALLDARDGRPEEVRTSEDLELANELGELVVPPLVAGVLESPRDPCPHDGLARRDLLLRRRDLQSCFLRKRRGPARGAVACERPDPPPQFARSPVLRVVSE